MFLGVDPGVNGAWGIVDEDTQIVAWYAGDGMITEFLAWQGAEAIEHAYLENQGLRHSDRGGKQFHVQKLLINFGQWQGVLQALGITFTLMAPMTWLSRWGCAGRGMTPTDRKKSYVEVARKLWPDRKWRDSKDHDLAAACLLAELCRVDFRGRIL